MKLICRENANYHKTIFFFKDSLTYPNLPP